MEHKGNVYVKIYILIYIPSALPDDYYRMQNGVSYCKNSKIS
jgi:hypothetical protein